MLALTIWQPHATLYVAGPKDDETRSWAPMIEGWKGPLAVHAANRPVDPEDEKHLRDYMHEALRNLHSRKVQWPRLCPLGSIIAVIETVEVWRTVGSYGKTNPFHIRGMDGKDRQITNANWACGDLSPGRYGWRRGKVHLLPDPVPCHGGRFLWEVPDGVEARVRALLKNVKLGPEDKS